MREFFETELKRLHLTTGLQQYSKLSDSEYTELLDILCAECSKFELIPDKAKREYIQEFMKTDPEFIGFNKRIIWKWLNIANRRHLPKDQSHFTEIKWVPPTQEEQAKINALLEQWKIDMMKIGNPTPQVDGIKDVRIQLMKEQLTDIKCKHTGLRVTVSDTTEVCNDCGQEFEKL